MLAALILGVVAPAAWLLTHAGQPHGQIVVFWVTQVAYDACFLALTRRVIILPGQPRATRRFWWGMALAGTMFTAADTGRLVLVLARSDPTLTSAGPLSVFVPVGVACLVCIMLTHPLGVSGRVRTRLWLDAATVMVAATTTVGYGTTLLGGGRPASLPTTLLGSAVLLVAIFAVVKLLLSLAGPFTWGAGLAGAAGAALLATDSVVSPTMTRPSELTLLLAFRMLPSVVWAMAPRIQELQERAALARVAPRPRRPYSVVPYVAIAMVLALLVSSLARVGTEPRIWWLLSGVIISIVLVVVRQLAAFSDNARLLGRLDESLLEQNRQEHRFRSLVQHSSDITVLTDEHGVISYASPALLAVLGRDPDRTVGTSCLDLVHPGDLAKLRPAMQEVATGGEAASATVQARVGHADGSWRWLEVTATNLQADPSVRAFVVNARDVTEERQLHDRLRHQASHDPLTALPNRALFAQRVRVATRSGRAADDESVSLLAIDLDGFKAVNDRFGHHVGDLLLATVAERLQACARAGDTPARMGGDEFALLLPGTSPAAAAAVGRRLERVLAEPMTLDGHLVTIRASIGVASGPAEEAERLVRSADAAMYVTKRGGAARAGSPGRPAA